MKKRDSDWDDNKSRSSSGSRISRGSFHDKRYTNSTSRLYSVTQTEKAEDDLIM